MLTKERFVYLINFIREQHIKEDKFCTALENMCPDAYVDAFIYSDYERELLQTIQEAMEIPEDDESVAYFMYDLAFGEDYKSGCVIDFNTGKEIDLSTSEKLYDHLVEVANENKNNKK